MHWYNNHHHHKSIRSRNTLPKVILVFFKPNNRMGRYTTIYANFNRTDIFTFTTTFLSWSSYFFLFVVDLSRYVAYLYQNLALVVSVSFNFPKKMWIDKWPSFFIVKGCVHNNQKLLFIYLAIFTLLLFICGICRTISNTHMQHTIVWTLVKMMDLHIYYDTLLSHSIFHIICMPKVQIGTFHYSIPFSFFFSFDIKRKISPADQMRHFLPRG